MSVRRVHQKSERTPEQLSELRAVRAHYQQEKPSEEDVLAESEQDAVLPLGEVILLREIFTQLRRERERQNLTLAEMELRTGIGQAALSRLETGKAANPTIDTIYRIAAALGKEVGSYLRDAAPTRPRTPAPT